VFAPVLLSSIARSGSAQEQYAVSSRPLYETGENGKLKQRSAQQVFFAFSFHNSAFAAISESGAIALFSRTRLFGCLGGRIGFGNQSSKHER
jgi:transcriptional regulator of acetoin/glycerol metabolism